MMAALSTRTKMLAALVMVGLFALGGITGAALMRRHQQSQLRAELERGPGPARARLRLRAMRRFLDLTSDQVAELETVIEEAEQTHHELRRQCGPQLEQLRTDTEAKIERVLTPEQRAQYRELQQRREKRRHQRRRRRRRGAPPPGEGPPPPPLPPDGPSPP
ncbi:MAG: hypothetical protein AAGN82_26345 [Myxococcota bacterium]